MPHRPQKVSSLIQFKSFWNLASIEISCKIRSWRNLRHEIILNPSQLRASRSTRGISVGGPESSLPMLWDLRPQTVILHLNSLRKQQFFCHFEAFVVFLRFCCPFVCFIFSFYVLLNFCLLLFLRIFYLRFLCGFICLI